MPPTSPDTRPSRGISQSSRRAFRNPWVLGMLGIVAVFVSVNATMISLAWAFKPALIDRDFYQKGRDIELNIESRRAAWEELGWETRFDLPGAVAGSEASWRFVLRDREGGPVSGAAIRLHARRPVSEEHDLAIVMAEVAPGDYAADFALPLSGYWDLIAEISHDGHSYSKYRRVLAGAE